eukprot:RCo003514
MNAAESDILGADEEKWTYLQELFHQLAACARGSFSVNVDGVLVKMRGYALCHNIIIHGYLPTKALALYQRVQKLVEDYLQGSTLLEAGSESQARTGVEILFLLCDQWQNHQVLARWCEKTFKYLDIVNERSKLRTSMEPVRTMVLKCFATAAYGRVKQSFVEAMFAEIEKDRDGAVANCEAVKVGTTLLVEIALGDTSLYREDFEKAFLEATRVYYRRACAEVLQQEGGRWRFLEWAEQRLAQEARRVAQCLLSITAEPLQKVLDEVILKDQLPTLLVDLKGSSEALDPSKAEDQRRMFTLCKRIDGGLAKMADVFRELISKEGAKLNAAFCKGEKDLVAYVEAVMELHGRCEEMISTRLEKCSTFLSALMSGFEAFINAPLCREVQENKTVKYCFAEILPTFCDHIMRNEKITPDQFAAKLDSIMSIFACISDKQHFEEVYRHKLSKRLVVTKTDPDHEKELLTKLKVAMGWTYVSKLTGMINDLQQSAELQVDFEEDCCSRKVALGLDLSVQVLRQGCWPSFKVEAMNLPVALSTAYECFRQFHSRKHPKRMLKLVHSLGTLTVIVGFASGQEKELTMTTVQGLVVEQLSYGSPMTITDLAKALDVSIETVIRSVTPLITNPRGLRPGIRTDILRREGETKGKLSPADVLSLNPSFACSARKLKLPRPADEGALQAAQDAAGLQKKYLLKAAIVRVMKARKTLELNSLQVEVTRQVSRRFAPDFRLVKTLVEDLIQREYLIRDAQKANVFRYVA